MGEITALTEKDFDNFISDGNVIIDFYADWCGPCKIMGPEFIKAASHINNVKFGKVNVEGNQDLAGRFQVMSIPTTIFFKNKEQVDRHTGALFEKDIEKKVKELYS